jgi:hypothetical protein
LSQTVEHEALHVLMFVVEQLGLGQLRHDGIEGELLVGSQLLRHRRQHRQHLLQIVIIRVA